jgi:hypothetical protein
VKALPVRKECQQKKAKKGHPIEKKKAEGKSNPCRLGNYSTAPGK